MADGEGIQYSFPIEQIDAIIDKINNGLTPMLTDEMMVEVKMRMKQLEEDIMNDDDMDDIDDELVARHKELVQRKIEEQKRKATKTNDIIIQLTDKQKEDIRQGMETSLVRQNPNSIYHMSDEDLNITQEKKLLLERASRIRNIYYNAPDFINAMNIIKDLIEYSLEHDYPWMSKEDAVKQFNEGKIKFTYCRIPKLMIDYRTEIKDPSILAGIMKGTVQLRSREEDEEELRRKKRKKTTKDDPGVRMKYHVDTDMEYIQMMNLSKQGFDTPMGVIIQANSHKYNRFSLPPSSRFAQQKKTDQINPNLARQMEAFDWEQEDAPQKYVELLLGKKHQLSDLIADLNQANDGKLNPSFGKTQSQFLYDLSHFRDIKIPDGLRPPTASSLQTNQEALEIENKILSMIKANNPTL